MSSSTVPTTSIEDLPPEMINELFKHLHPRDLVVCSRVNKRWHSIYSNFKLHRLDIISPISTICSYKYLLFQWYDLNQTIQDTERCSVKMFRRLTGHSQLLSNLKHLAISASFKIDLNKLNCRFPQLVHLEINFSLSRNVHLNLLRLEVLVFHESNPHYAHSIDCPRLRTLAYHETTPRPLDRGVAGPMAPRLKVKHPEIIRKLDTNMVGEKLTPFKGVECLVTRNYQTISRGTLLALPRLRELHYNNYNNYLWSVFNNENDRVDQVKRTLSELLDDAKKLRGGDFRLRFAGFQLTSTMLEQIDFGMQVHGRERVCTESIYMKNYQLIEPGALHYIREVDYTRLLSHVTGEFPRCFAQKFTGIKVVQVTDRIEDADQFFWFLKSLRSLRELILIKTGLNQEFYDKLPASAFFLIKLRLRDGHCEDELQVNFDFLRCFSCLSSLHIEPELSLELLHALIRWLGRLEVGHLHFQFRGEKYGVEKCSSVMKVVHSTIKAKNPEEMVNFFEWLQINVRQ